MIHGSCQRIKRAISNLHVIVWSSGRALPEEDRCSSPEATIVTYISQQHRPQYRILTSYLHQKLKLQGLLAKDCVSTIDTTQGSEWRGIIFSFGRHDTKIGFNHDGRRVNVVFSRSKKGLVIVVHASVVDGSCFGEVASFWPNMCRAWSKLNLMHKVNFDADWKEQVDAVFGLKNVP